MVSGLVSLSSLPSFDESMQIYPCISAYGDWDNWSPWKVTDTGVLKRKRSCKKSNCIGASEQTKRRRKYVIEGSWEITSTQGINIIN